MLLWILIPYGKSKEEAKTAFTGLRVYGFEKGEREKG